MKKLLLLFLGLIFLYANKPENFQSKSIDESELKVLKEIVLADTIPTVYFKTIVSDMNQPLSRQLFYLTDFDVCNFLVNLDSMSLNREERSYLAERFTTMADFSLTISNLNSSMLILISFFVLNRIEVE